MPYIMMISYFIPYDIVHTDIVYDIIVFDYNIIGNIIPMISQYDMNYDVIVKTIMSQPKDIIAQMIS